MTEGAAEEVLIVGSGPAGLTAGIYTARAALSTLILAGAQPGGQMTITNEVENYPGFENPISGPELMESMRTQAMNCGARIEFNTVLAVKKSVRGFQLDLEKGDPVHARSVILATGAKAKWLGLESEEEFLGRGVSACATCDGPFFRNQTVFVVGGGNTAVEEAIHLASLCEHVILVHRRDQLRAEMVLQQRLFALKNVTVQWASEVAEILGDGMGMNAVRLKSTKNGEETVCEGMGLFVAIGHQPATAAFADILALDTQGYVQLANPGGTETSIPGLFAAGDCADRHYRQAVTAAGMGCMAAIDAQAYLEKISRGDAA